VAEAFFYVGLIERWGTGTTRMADALREAGLAEPEFDNGRPVVARLPARPLRRQVGPKIRIARRNFVHVDKISCNSLRDNT
jgi:hypothetical protein